MSGSTNLRYVEAILLIGIGGFLGANARFLFEATAGESLMMTLGVNVIGSFGLGLLLFELHTKTHFSNRFRYIFGTGFFASFTTYSTFIADIALSEPTIAVGYILGSYFLGFLAVVVSRWIINRLESRKYPSEVSNSP